MNYLVTPKTAEALPATSWVNSAEATLGGYFYDHLCNSAGSVVGVRYWVDPSMSFDRHPVYGQFTSDERFKFNQDHGYVDIVFNDTDAEALKRGMLTVNTVQDFGGDHVVKQGNTFGIAFSL